MANFDGDMSIDIAVEESAKGKGVGTKLLERAIRYYFKNHEKLAEKNGVDPEDYSLIVLPISPKMYPLLEKLGFKKNGNEFSINATEHLNAR